jgi:hypothetical protein
MRKTKQNLSAIGAKTMVLTCSTNWYKNVILSGEVVAMVWITKHKDIIVDWHNNGYRLNETVLELIEDSKKELRERYAI